jgi:Protein of unknown function (DUF2950)
MSMFVNPYQKVLARAALFGIALAIASLPQAVFAAPVPQQESFTNPNDAVTALVKAVQIDNKKSLKEILGPGSEALISSGDKVADATAARKFIDAYTASHTLTQQPDGSMVLTIGENAWPLPIPLVQAGGRWHFDATTGAQEIVDRRIGRNELLTIQTLLAGVDAEEDYFARVKAGTGTGAYAERMISSPGTENGLYWDVADGASPSPLGPLIAQAQNEGYPGATVRTGRQTPYHGYFFRILKAQGPDAPGGAKTYIQNGLMTNGFAIVAWPAGYGASGIMTFVVNQDGIVFQKNLGAKTAGTAAGMTLFNPDFSWARVDIGK